MRLNALTRFDDLRGLKLCVITLTVVAVMGPRLTRYLQGVVSRSAFPERPLTKVKQRAVFLYRAANRSQTILGKRLALFRQPAIRWSYSTSTMSSRHTWEK